MADHTTDTLSGELWEKWETRTLIRALPHLVHNKFAQVYPMPQGMGETIKFRKFGELSTVSAALTEGVTPAAHSTTVTTVTATMDFYGAYLTHTDKLRYTAFDPIIQHFNDVLGEQCGRSIDILTRTEMVSGFTTNVVYPSTYTNVNQITSADILDYDLLSKGIAIQGTARARPVEGMKFPVIMHWYTWRDLMRDEIVREMFQADNANAGTNPFRSGRVGELLNMVIYVTDHAYVNTDAGASSTDVYYTFILGQEAYGVSGISGFTPNMPNVATPDNQFGGMTGQTIKPVEIILKDLGSAGAADPLNQRASAAWKASHVAKTLQAAFATVIRHATTMGS
jgi:N4-gp56 family major capsid protein